MINSLTVIIQKQIPVNRVSSNCPTGYRYARYKINLSPLFVSPLFALYLVCPLYLVPFILLKLLLSNIRKNRFYNRITDIITRITKLT